MPQRLPRKIKLAFIAQASVATLVITLGIVLGCLAVRQLLLQDHLQREAQSFWNERSVDPAYPLPRHSLMTGYLEQAGTTNRVLPEGIRGMPEGLHAFPPGPRVVFVDRRAEGAFYMVFKPRLIDRAIFWTGGVALFLALMVVYLASWLTYRTSKRLVSPVSWLANVVAQWDPRVPDANLLTPDNLPGDAASEVHDLTRALAGLAIRVGDFVQRERDFTRDASHELRTPLTVIRVATDLILAEPDLSPRLQRSLGRVQHAGRDMEAVIDAFLILAREADVEPRSEQLAVRAIVDDEIDRARPLLADKPVELVVIDDGAPHLIAPRHVLNVMIANLLSNAARYTDQGQIVLYLAGDRIEVRDSGIGMSPDTLAKAFDPFFRIDNERLEGKGIGLSIVRRLGERFGWPVTLTSTPGIGTIAVIRFDV